MNSLIPPVVPNAGSRVRLSMGDETTGTVALPDGRTCGSFRLEGAGDALVIQCLSIDEGERGYGLGTEAAHLLRDAAIAGGWDRIRAWAPPDRGLAVYFWSRMGFRPLFGERPGGGIWFERVLDRADRH